MSTAPSRQEQTDITELLTVYSELASIAILAASKGDTVVTLNNALAGKFKAGKQPGISIIVEQPEEKPTEKDAGPLIETRTHTVTICELVMQNRKQDGSGDFRAGMTRDEAKDHVKAALHYQWLGKALLTWSGTQPFNDGEGGQGYVVKFEVQGNTPQTARASDPIVSQSVASVAVAATPASFVLSLSQSGETGSCTLVVNGTSHAFSFGASGNDVENQDDFGELDPSVVAASFAAAITGAGLAATSSAVGANVTVTTTGTGASRTLSFDRNDLTDTFTNPPADATGTAAVIGGLATVTITGTGTLRYTDDGTTPVPGGTTVQIYTAPIEDVAVGTVIRAAATATGKMISGITEQTVE